MSIEISGTPTPVPCPRFAGLTIRVPLTEEPTKVWLDLLALQSLPGKGFRLDGAALEFHLDRNDHDVLSAMRKLADAIAKTGEVYERQGAQQEAGATRAEERDANLVRKVSGQLQQWWEDHAPSPVPTLIDGGSSDTDG
jgi:hypothetical protein